MDIHKAIAMVLSQYGFHAGLVPYGYGTEKRTK